MSNKLEWLTSGIAGEPQPKKAPDPAGKKTRRSKKKVVLKVGRNGSFETENRWVDNPHFDPEMPKIEAQVNIRHDILIHWHARGQIGDAQFFAGQKLQKIWERAKIGDHGTCIPTNSRVDASGIADHLTVGTIEAIQELAEIEQKIGCRDMPLLLKAICEGKKIEAIAGERKRAQIYIGQRIRDALDDLAGYWGAIGAERAEIRAEHFHYS